MDRIIFHIDVNSAFLSWEAVHRIKHLQQEEDLREIPSAVGGDIMQRRGIILAKSLAAKKYGIKTGETLLEARRKCSELVIVPPNYILYETCSKAFIKILERYSPRIEQFSIDEAFLDMTGTNLLFGEPVKAANMIREQVKNELGFTVNIGISSNKLLAKMASDFKKPDMVHTLFFDEIKDKMWPLPVFELYFVGRATTKKLFNLGIKTIGELANSDKELLKFHLKKQGELVHEFANGIDISLVEDTKKEAKGYGNSTTIAFDVTDASTAKMVLLNLCEKVSMRLRKAKVKAEVISVGIKTCDFKYLSHQSVLINPTNITREVHEVVSRLFDEAWNNEPIRHLGVHACKIVEEESVRQISLFDDTDYKKLERVDKAIDEIRKKYGTSAIKRATFIDPKDKSY